MKRIENKQFDEERALYGLRDTEVINCRFDGPADGESAFKECERIVSEDCFFNLRYPFWHVTDGTIRGAEMTELCRAALWYDRHVTLEHCRLHGIKALRECEDVTLADCDVVSPEFLWRCRGVKVRNVTMQSEYPFFECRDVTVERLTMKGKYSFQYVENMTIKNSELDTKDAFWHAKNVTVTDSTIRGEYLGWYSENLKLIRCRIVGTQPLCYCRGLVLGDCTMENTGLSFERSEVNATVRGRIDSVKNPLAGRIVADEIGELISESEYVDPTATEILCERMNTNV